MDLTYANLYKGPTNHILSFIEEIWMIHKCGIRISKRSNVYIKLLPLPVVVCEWKQTQPKQLTPANNNR